MKLSRRLAPLFFALLALPAMAVDMLPTFGAVQAGFISSDALLLDRDGQPLADRRFDAQVRRLDWVSLQGLPVAMREALLVAEDKRFFEHEGVDWMAFAGAVWQNLWGTRRGASTLTMQLAGLLDPALALPNRGRERRSLTQKWDQGRAAIELERRWSKPQILEAYLNLAPFRGDLQGVGAASELLFGLPTAQLTRREAVILAALLRGPNARPALVAQRACALAAKLGSSKLCPEITRLALNRLDAPRNVPRYELAPQLAQSLLSERGQRVTTLLDAQLQRTTLENLQQAQLAEASAVLLDNASGAVLVWTGEADGVTRRRLLGDWWSPFLAALAIERGLLSAASLLPATDATALPHSMANRQQSLRSILASQQAEGLQLLAHRLESHSIGERLQALGLEPPPGLLLPGARGELSLLQLAAAWRSMAAGGNFVAPRVLPQDNGFRSVSGPEGSFIALDMLANGSTSGWQTHWACEALDGSSVVVGSNERYTLALTARGPRNARKPVLRLWQAVLAGVTPEPAGAPPPPPGVEAGLVVFEPPVEAVRREWLLRAGQANGTFHRVGTP